MKGEEGKKERKKSVKKSQTFSQRKNRKENKTGGILMEKGAMGIISLRMQIGGKGTRGRSPGGGGGYKAVQKAA